MVKQNWLEPLWETSTEILGDLKWCRCHVDNGPGLALETNINS